MGKLPVPMALFNLHRRLFQILSRMRLPAQTLRKERTEYIMHEDYNTIIHVFHLQSTTASLFSSGRRLEFRMLTPDLESMETSRTVAGNNAFAGNR
jgi:hypothetical protein